MSASITDDTDAQADQMNAPSLRAEIEEQVEKDSTDDDDVFMANSEGGHGSSHCASCVVDSSC